jgi:hypothetical protein
MATKTVKIEELFELSKDLNQILSERLSLAAKFEVNTLRNKVEDSPEMKAARKTQTELLEKHGDKNALGQFDLQVHIADPDNPKQMKINPKLKDFNDDFKPVTEKEIEFEYTPIDIAAIGTLESNYGYVTLFKFAEKKVSA